MNLINIIDDNLSSLIFKLDSRFCTLFLEFISHLGSAITVISLTIALLIMFKKNKESKMIALNLILAFSLNTILKNIFRRPRPLYIKYIIQEGYSFPSSHATVSIAFYGFLIYLIFKKVKNKKVKYPLIISLSLIILLIGISRIYLGVHYPTDVIAGFLIGVIYLAFFIKYIYNHKKKEF